MGCLQIPHQNYYPIIPMHASKQHSQENVNVLHVFYINLYHKLLPLTNVI